MNADRHLRAHRLPRLVTYDETGQVVSVSHVSAETAAAGIGPGDLRGKHVSAFGDAMEILGRAMLKRRPIAVRDIYWTPPGHSHQHWTRCLISRLEDEARIAIVGMAYRRWTLTELEESVVERIADGDSLAEAAAFLHRSEDAVKSTLARVRLKTDSRTTTEAVVKCVRAGLI